MDEQLRAEIVRRGKADSAAVQAFLDAAEEFRDLRDDRSDVPWPYSLLERTPAPEVVRNVLNVVRDNTTWLRGIVNEYGWPGRSLVGDDGADAAWLILLHAGSGVPTIGTPDNLLFQAACVPLLQAAAHSGDIPPRHLAHIVDNLHARAGEPHEYAVLNTAFVHNGAELVLRADLDPDQIDKSRHRIGLDSLEDELSRRRD